MKLPGRSLRRSFRTKVAGVALITTIAALLVAFIVILVQGSGAVRQQALRTRGFATDVLAYNLAESLEFYDRGGAQLRLQSVINTPGFRAAYVFDRDGQLFVHAGAKMQNVRPNPQQGLKSAGRFSALGLEYHSPIIVDHQRIGELVVISDLSALWGVLVNFLVLMGISFSAATAMALLTGLWLARIIIEPVSRLARAMDRVRRSGEFGHAVERISDDEVGQLTDAFNDMLSDLKHNDQSLREAFSELTKARDLAEEANVQKSQFLANVSHEIRTPLNGVLGMAQAMRMAELPPDQLERLEVIRNSGEILLAVLNDILDISKIEAGKLELEAVSFNLEELVEAVTAMFAPTAHAKGIYLNARVSASAKGAWTGDPTRLRQILSNLVSNALKFTQTGGVVVDVEADEAGLHIQVRDTGIGIPPDKRGQLFNKFAQVDSSTSRRFGGTGLGLAICRELAALMNGRISVDSAEGDGSCFSVDLPLARPANIEPATTADEAAENSEPLVQHVSRTLRVLAADDNATNRMVLRALLDPLDVDLTLVEDGRQAIDTWRDGQFDVILMDVQMPEMDGVEATVAIRSEEAHKGRRATPIFALSANAMAHQIQEYMAAGMSGHIAKPIDVARLYEALSSVPVLSEAA